MFDNRLKNFAEPTIRGTPGIPADRRGGSEQPPLQPCSGLALREVMERDRCGFRTTWVL